VTSGQLSGGEIDEDVGPPLALVPVAPAGKPAKRKGFAGNWRKESLLGMGKAAGKRFHSDQYL